LPLDEQILCAAHAPKDRVKRYGGASTEGGSAPAQSRTATISPMNTHVDHLIDEALALAPDERSAVVLALLDCLDGEDQASVVQAWADEIRQRMADLRSRTAKALPWSEARARLSALSTRVLEELTVAGDRRDSEQVSLTSARVRRMRSRSPAVPRSVER
jgi:putative addiction module component (TIGR02574 family)